MAATSCSSFFNNLRPGGRPRASPGCGGKLDVVATWLINSVTSAFFASLDRCSCVRVTTVDDGEDFNDVPLIFNDGNTRDHNDGIRGVNDNISSNVRRRGGRRKKSQGYINADHVQE